MDELAHYTAIPAQQHKQERHSHVTFAASSARWLRAPSERRAGDVASFNREDQYALFSGWPT